MTRQFKPIKVSLQLLVLISIRCQMLGIFLILCSFCCTVNAVGPLGQHHSKMYNQSHHLDKPWTALSEVDGLKNEDVAMLISSSEIHSFMYLRGR